MPELRPAGVERRTFLRYTSALGAAAAITAGLLGLRRALIDRRRSGREG